AVTCLYSAGVSTRTAIAAPHASQNLAFSRSPVPHDPHATPAVIRVPPISGPDHPYCPRVGRSPAKNGVIDRGAKRFPDVARPRHRVAARRLRRRQRSVEPSWLVGVLVDVGRVAPLSEGHSELRGTARHLWHGQPSVFLTPIRPLD